MYRLSFSSTVLVVLGALSAATQGTPAEAQSQDQTRSSLVSLDLTFGVQVTRGGGTYRENEDQVLSKGGDVLLAIRTYRWLGGSVIAGMSASSHLVSRSFDDSCVLASDGTCMPHFPTLYMVAGHVGWQNAEASSRILLGLAMADSDLADRSIGMQLRFDGAADMNRRLALVFGARATMVPNHGGERFYAFGAGLGFRIR